MTGRWVEFTGAGEPFRLRTAQVRTLLPGEVLVRNRYTTLCGSDLHTFCGVRQEVCPTVLGHEIAGEIVALHPSHSGLDSRGEELVAGSWITWSVFASDPQSKHALQGMPQKGEGLFKYGHAKVEGEEVFHGGLAEYCILKPHTAILLLPDFLPLPVAATLNCAIATVAGAMRLAGNVQGKRVLITGMGLLGITCAAMCKDAGATWVVAADVSDARLKKATGFGADETRLLDGDTPALLSEKADVVFDMSGAADAMEWGIDCLGIGGRAVWAGAVFKGRRLQLDAEKVVRNLLTIQGIHNYNYDDFAYALDFMKRNWNRYPFGEVVEKEFTLEQTQQAFEYAIQHKPLRVGISI
ncbi:putative phosphonate catabolism associated alcohol dehydrogenase [Filimonas lacunae]|uniref:alcohol dehydrogenase n=1 Tax=Filimonas lacunae TaxID=477680 RepID=A0A173M991_9BACT|nr:zinc-binding dehydrogenase [Filimonas lacunae]BAV04093.1 threonine dehydrogenase and related Zn-dependent dehydrogenase [Filimonas lacunae]SIT15532.1 putative phosphonate catabolism associated alcohol dehydrogenase [Filimonas lacunae]